MSWEAWFVCALVLLILFGLAFRSAAPDIMMMGGVTLLLVMGILTPEQALAGFSNPGMVVIAVLYVVVAGLQATGGVQWLAASLLGRPGNLAMAQLRLMLPVATLSAFINNTPVTAMMIPAIADWSRRIRQPVSRLMMPLSYAAMLGGVCTLIGSSTNLIVNGMLQQQGHTGMGLFELSWVGIPCAVLGMGYIMLFSKRLLPVCKASLGLMDDPREYTTEMVVDAKGALVGKTVEQAGLRNLEAMYLIEIERDGQILPVISPQDRLMQNDRLVFAGVVGSVVELHRIRGLLPVTDQVFKLTGPRPDRVMVEAVVSDACPIIGMTIREGRFRSLYNAAIIAVARNGERIKKKIGDIVLQTGDTLLLEAQPSFYEQQRNARDFFLVSPVQGAQLPRHDRATLAVAVLAGMVLLVVGGVLDILQAAMLAAGGMLLLRCVNGRQARASIDWSILLTIAGSIALGTAMQTTGAADHIAGLVVGLGGNNPWLTLGLVYGLTALFTAVISNNAAAVLMFPIIWTSATQMGVSPMPFVVVLMLAASASFATPIGYQTNLMVLGPGGYHFRDYVRFGLPLTLLLGLLSTALVPLIWPF